MARGINFCGTNFWTSGRDTCDGQPGGERAMVIVCSGEEGMSLEVTMLEE